MDEIIIKEMIRTKAWLIALLLCSAVLTVFFVNGIYCAFWNVPLKNIEITELTNQLDVYQARAKELEKYIEVREGQYRVATKCSQFFMMIANSKQILGMEGVEELIKSKKAFFEPVKTKGE